MTDADGRHGGDMAPGDGRRHVDVRFCGGCDPWIDRVAVADAVDEALAARGAGPATGREGGADGEASANGGCRPASGTDGRACRPRLCVSGCERACASDHRLALEGTHTVVIAGYHVDGLPTIADRLAETAVRRLCDATSSRHGRRTDRATSARPGAR